MFDLFKSKVSMTKEKWDLIVTTYNNMVKENKQLKLKLENSSNSKYISDLESKITQLEDDLNKEVQIREYRLDKANRSYNVKEKELLNKIDDLNFNIKKLSSSENLAWKTLSRWKQDNRSINPSSVQKKLDSLANKLETKLSDCDKNKSKLENIESKLQEITETSFIESPESMLEVTTAENEISVYA